MPPQNILLMSRTLGHGGTERQLTTIALALDRDLFTPHVVCVDGQGFRGEELRARGVPILELPFDSLTSAQCVSCIIRLRQYFRRHGIALVHTFDTPMNVFGVAAAKLPGGPPVLSSQRCFENVMWPRHRPLNRIAHRLADGIIANCQAVEKHLVNDFSIPARKIHVCYNGLDTSVFCPAPALRPEPLRNASLVIGAVCVLRPEKGLATLLEAFATVKPLYAGLRLVIVGSGPELGALERLSGALGIADECLFYPSTNDVAGWLRAIDIAVLPSLSEAFSNSIMEAMACGCCTIASRVGGTTELIDDGKTGLLFDAGSAISLAEKLRLALDNPELRRSLSQKSQSVIADRFSSEASARCMEEIYRRYVR